MEPFLKTISREYSKRYADLKQVCFLFPNKRCGIFLKKYLAESGRKGDELPHVLTISDFTSLIARKKEASKIEQLFILYKCYLEILGVTQETIEFESFRSWGETILADFNTVDMYLVNPGEIYKNIRDYREISTDFLTEDQKEVMREYFGIDEFGNSQTFWKHFEDPEKMTPLKQKFLNLWQVMGPLHELFVARLAEKGLGSTGSIYRGAVERLKNRGREILPFKKIIVVGFNALTEAERKIFGELKETKGYPDYDSFADFIWDAKGPILNNKSFSASKFVIYNKKYFPSPEWWDYYQENEKDVYPDIDIIAAPSITSQVKVAGEILKRYGNEKGRRMIDEAEVALVLPDEGLLTNMLYSLPEDIGDVNLTMSYSLRQSSISSFMSLLRRLYVSMRESDKGNIFYAKDLKMFLSHPYSYILFQPEEIESLLDLILQSHKVSLYADEINDKITSFGELLNLPSKKTKDDEIFQLLGKIFEKLLSNLSENSEGNNVLDIDQVTVYSEYVSDLKESLNQYDIQISPLSVLQTVDRLISSEKIGFEGEPLYGLQIMGTLETRSVDFKHVIILSMNEGIMPRKSFSSTFIPESLRKAYGLPPSHYAEEIFGYYFYRLISRAEKVTLISDGRTISGLRGGESRYLLQLRHYVPSDKLKEENWQYNLNNRDDCDASVQKNDEIKVLLEKFSKNDESRKNLSASSLNTYRECQVKFFLQNLMNVSPDPERGEFIDAITTGDVLHEVMMQLYMPSHLQKKLLKSPVKIDKSFLENILNNKDRIRSLVIQGINKIYYGNKENEFMELKSGVSDIISDQIVELVLSIVNYDMGIAPFNLYGCEISEKLQVTLSNGRRVNFRFAIDRLDEIIVEGEHRLRIVDYKTGSRKRFASGLEEVFEGGYSSEQIFQLFTYAWLLGKIGVKGWEDVVTEIYFVPDLVKGIGGLPKIGNKEVKSFREYYQEFDSRLEKMVESIFNEPEFKESKDINACELCSFKTFCGKW